MDETGKISGWEKDIRDILLRTQNLPKARLRVVAARCSYRVLPITFLNHRIGEKPFACWGDQSPFVIRSLEVACILSAAQIKLLDAARAAASVAEIAAAQASGTPASFAAASTGSLRHGPHDALVAAASQALRAIESFDIIQIFVGTLEEDLYAAQSESAEGLLATPLWRRRDPELGQKWSDLLSDWRQALSTMRLGDIAERYASMTSGMWPGIESSREILDGWYIEYQEWEKKSDITSPSTIGSNTESGTIKNDSRSDQTTKNDTRTDQAGQSDTETGQTIESVKIISPEQPSPHGLATGMADRPSRIDSLGRKPLVDTLARIFTHVEQATPMTIALLGEWGSGKSSVLTQFRAQVEDEADIEGRVPCVFAEFNAWEHEHCEDMQAGLAQSVITALTDGFGRVDRLKLAWSFANRVHQKELEKHAITLTVFAVATLVGVALMLVSDIRFFQGLAGTTAGASLIAFFVYVWKYSIPVLEAPVWREIGSYVKIPDYRDRMGQVPVMKRHLDAMCRLRDIGPDPENIGTNLKKSDRKRLVLFVDDLDRCAPKTIVTMLDAVRLVMDEPGIIVVLAIDPGVLMEAVTSEDAYGDRGRDYLSKIIQLPIHLGRPQGHDLKGFARGLILVTEEKGAKEPSTGMQPPASPRSTIEANSDSSDRNEADASTSDAAGQATEQVDLKSSETDEGDMPTAVITRSELFDPTEKELDDAMGHTQKEQTLFADLAGMLSIDNPRRLIRLRNTYRLMKLMWFRALSDGERESYDPLVVMQVLFVADAISEWDASENGTVILKQLEQKRVDNNAIKLSSHINFQILESQVSATLKRVEGTYMDITHRVTGDLFRLARSLLLPHPEFDLGPDRDESRDGASSKNK